MASRKIEPENSLRILDTRLHADPSRVVLRPFHLGWQAKNAPGGRAQKLVEDIVALPEERVVTEYARVLRDFDERHWQIEQMFEERFRGGGGDPRLQGSRLVAGAPPADRRLFLPRIHLRRRRADEPLDRAASRPERLPRRYAALRHVAARGGRGAYQLDRLSRGHRLCRRRFRAVAAERLRHFGRTRRSDAVRLRRMRGPFIVTPIPRCPTR